MSEARAGREAAYELRAPRSGAGVLDPRSALLVWGIGSTILGLTVSYLLIKGHFRELVLLLLGVMGLASLPVRRGVYILTIFLPFMYFLRRQVLAYQEFSARDPILLFPALTALAILAGVIVFQGRHVVHYTRRSSILLAAAALAGIFVLQVFNPLQGNLLVGVAGGMYFIVPMAWLAFGLFMKREDIERILWIVMVIGLVTAVYGLYQHYWGLSEVEIYELKAKRFFKTFGDASTVRIMSTFSSLGDFSLYQSIAGFICFALFWRSKKNPIFLFVLMLNLFTMVWTSVRTSFLLLMFSCLILMAVYGRNFQRIVLRGVAVFLAILVTYSVLYTYEPERMYDRQFSSNPYVVHAISGVTHPTKENTFQGRLVNWRNVFTGAFTEFPWGHGLGSTTSAVSKFVGVRENTTDSYFFELFYGSGLVAPFLFLLLVVLVLRSQLAVCLATPTDYLPRIVLALLCGGFLGSLFGYSMRDTIAAPLLWLLVGWCARQQVDALAVASPVPSTGPILDVAPPRIAPVRAPGRR